MRLTRFLYEIKQINMRINSIRDFRFKQQEQKLQQYDVTQFGNFIHSHLCISETQNKK